MSLVSATTGKPIKRTTRADPLGFGLGVSQSTVPVLGTVWRYSASTWGFRSLLVYLPRSGTTFAMGANSLPEQDGLPQLSESVYRRLQGRAFTGAAECICGRRRLLSPG